MFTNLTAADGHQFECWMVSAKGARRGGIVILQEIFGVTEQLRGVARHYADLGFDVAIPALFDRQSHGAIIPFSEAPTGRDLMLAAKQDETMADIDAAITRLRENGPGVGVIGFCWGGGLAIRTAQILTVDAAVAFYGTRLPEYLDRPLNAPLQGHYGTTDSHVPLDMLQAAQDYFPEFEVYTYKAGHAFANDARPTDYAEESAQLAHARSLEFLSTHLG